MYVEEEVGRKTSTVEVVDWEQAYREIKNLLENRFFFHRVEEEKFRHHVERGLVITKINCFREVDDYTTLEITMVLTINQEGPEDKSASVTIDSKGEVVTRYPEENWFTRTVWYYALRSIWDKFIYGWARGKWKDEAEQLLIDVHSEIRGFLESIEKTR